jgi:hypothetical protein
MGLHNKKSIGSSEGSTRFSNQGLHLPVVIFFSLILFLSSSPVQAIPVGDWDLIPYPLFWGVGLSATYSGLTLFSGQDTKIVLGLSGAYESDSFYRKPSGRPYTPPEPDLFLQSGDAGYKKASATITSGIRQSFFFDRRLSAFLLYRSYLDINTPSKALIFSSDLADKDGIWQNSFTSGLIFSDIDSDVAHGTKKGLSAEVSVEAAPEFLGNSIYGRASYGRVNFKLITHGVLFDLAPGSPRNLLSLVLSGRTAVDLLWGGYIPVNALTSIGGYYRSSALGGVVRGVQSGRYDGPLKITQNVDLRLNLPSVWLIVPAVAVYGDIGISDDPRPQRVDGARQLHTSTGAGFFLGISGFDMGVSIDYHITENTASMSVAFGSSY